jgi:hypothetical protein
LEGCDGLIFANNELTGGDLMSTGGGIANYSTNCSQNICFAHNRMSLAHGWDREIMTTDAGGGAYFGKVKNVEGAGQYRRLVKCDGDQIEVDRAWQVEPDRDCQVHRSLELLELPGAADAASLRGLKQVEIGTGLVRGADHREAKRSPGRLSRRFRRGCTLYECNMCGSNHREEADRRPLWLCPHCLAKLCHATGADPVRRFKDLVAFSRREGLKPEQEFYEKSLAVLGTCPAGF